MHFNISIYVLVSFILFTFAFLLTLQSFLKSDMKFASECYASGSPNGYHRHQPPIKSCNNNYIGAFITFVESQKWSLMFHVNMPICCFILLGYGIIKSVFGELCPMESQHMYDRILNFLLFKVIVIGAVMDPVWRYILRLSLWVSILGFLQIFNLLCRDRFENLTMVSSAPHKVYHKITVLLCGLLLSNIIWYTGSMVLFPNYLTFLTLEFLPVTLDTLQVITKYWAHLLDQSWESGFERKWLINYYAEITADVLILGCTLIQYLHLMWIHGISLGMVDIILFFNVRSVLIVLHKKVLVHRERWRMESYVQRRYKDATDQELDAYDDDCAICRDPMKSAKKLSCGHIFHLHCLHLWIQHHVSKLTCPTCRHSLSSSSNEKHRLQVERALPLSG